MTLVAHRPYAAFLLLAACVWAVSVWLVRSPHFLAHPDALAVGVSLDLTVTTALIWMLVVVRTGAARLATTAPVFLAGYGAAHLLLPSGHPGALGAIELVAVAMELAVLGTVAWKARAIRARLQAHRAGGHSWLDAAEEALTEVLGNRLVARVAATEAATIRYGLLGWFERAPRDGFSTWREVGWPAVLGVFSFLIAVETVALHLIVERYSLGAAWVLTALSAYSLLWLLGDWNALRLDPVRVDRRGVEVAVGLRWRVRVPWERIARVEAACELEEREGNLNASVFGAPSVVITTDRPLEAHGPFGIRRTFTRIGLSIDDVPAFLATVNATRG